MTYPNLNKELIAAIRPMEAESYLQSKGWNKASPAEAHTSMWTNDRESGQFEVTVPQRTEFSDYPLMLWNLIRTLSVVEHRSIPDLLSDLTAAASDVFKFRSLATSAADGTIPLVQGLDLIEGAYQFVTSVAWSTVRARRVVTASKARSVLDYLDAVRLRQTEHGSYVVNIAAPLPTERPPATGQPALLSTPFARTVTEKMVESLGAVQTLLHDSPGLFEIPPWDKAANTGLVSANLCESLVRMSGKNGRAALEISVAWSPSRPRTTPTKSQFLFESAQMPQIDQAAQYLRARNPEQTTLVGIVVNLANPPKGRNERMVVQGRTIEKALTVTVPLNSAQREIAIRAYETKQTIACTGVLVQRGKHYTLEHLQNLVIPNDGDAPEPEGTGITKQLDLFADYT